MADRRMRVKGRLVKHCVKASSSSRTGSPPPTGSPLCTVDKRDEEKDDGQQPVDEDMPDVKDLEAGFEPSDDMPHIMRTNNCLRKSIQPNGEADTQPQAKPTNNDMRFDYAGRWTKEENETFLSGFKMHGKDWTKVAAHVSTRTVTQTRSHAQKYLQKLSKDEVR